MSVDLKVSNKNFLEWGEFEDWENGTSSAPTSYLLGVGTGATIARESTIIKHGTYSAKLTRITNDTYLRNSDWNSSIIFGKPLTYWQGRTVTFGSWVYATVNNRLRLIIHDGVTATGSTYHTGDSTWQFLTLTKSISSAATYFDVYYSLEVGDTSVYFDGAILCEGTTTFLDISQYVESWDLDRNYRNQKYIIARRPGVITPNTNFNEQTLTIKGKVWNTTAATARTSWDSFLQYMNNGEKDIYLWDDRFVRGYLVDESHKYIAALRATEYTMKFSIQDPFNYYVQKLRSTTTVDSSPKSITVTTTGNIYMYPVLTFTAGSVPITSLTFQNLTTAETFTYSGTVAAYKSLEIDCENLTVENDGTDDIANFTGDFLKLNSGANSLLYTGTTLATVKVDWRDRWL